MLSCLFILSLTYLPSELSTSLRIHLLSYLPTYYPLTYLLIQLLTYLLTYVSQEWLRGYRLGDGAKDGGVGVYVLSRQQLQRWWYVDELPATELQEKYRSECGVYAHRSNLVRWLKAWPFPNILYVLFYGESSVLTRL